MRTAPLLLLLATACTTEAPVEGFAPLAATGEVPGAPDLGDAVDAAAAQHGVPADLLLAIGRTETRLQWIAGEAEFPGQDVAHGVLALRESLVEEAAGAAGVAPEAATTELLAHVEAVAALLSAWADEADVDRADLDAWAPVVARYSGIDDPDAQAHYVWDEVYGHLEAGFATESVAVEARKVAPAFPEPVRPTYAAGPDRSYTIWRPSPNYNSRPSGSTGNVEMVVIHSCEGSYSGCWSWLTNPSAGVSAHYVVNDDGSEISQLVRESDRAWHVGASYDSSLNGGVESWLDGVSVNHFSVGIEHAGYASQSWWDPDLLDASAQLSCDITDDHGVPIDAYHIVAHGTLQPWSRTDPGASWPWSDYLDRVRTACGSGPPPTGTSFVIDSNNALNDTSRYSISVSGDWFSSTSVSGYWGTGYWAAPTAPVSDPADFTFRVDTPTCYQVEAWWTAATDRAPTATFIAWDPSGTELARRSVDMRSGGGRWNTLFTARFPVGWNDILLSRWTTSGAYVIADAVRLTEDPTGCGGTLDLTMDDVDPGVAGTSNDFVAAGATPSTNVVFLAGRVGGSTSVPGCPGVTVPFGSPTVLGSDRSDGSGEAVLTKSVPGSIAGRTFDFVAVEPSTCRVSDPLAVTF